MAMIAAIAHIANTRIGEPKACSEYPLVVYTPAPIILATTKQTSDVIPIVRLGFVVLFNRSPKKDCKPAVLGSPVGPVQTTTGNNASECGKIRRSTTSPAEKRLV